MKTTLPTRGEAWKHYKKIGNFYDTPHYYNKFDIFCDRILQLWMFIPCKDGVPLEEPVNYDKFINKDKFKLNKNNFSKEWITQCKEYQKAKERVIFKGFTHEIIDNYLHLKTKTFHIVYNLRDNNFVAFKLISDLCNKVELTESEYKRLGL